jgi:hypothetical protein
MGLMDGRREGTVGVRDDALPNVFWEVIGWLIICWRCETGGVGIIGVDLTPVRRGIGWLIGLLRWAKRAKDRHE